MTKIEAEALAMALKQYVPDRSARAAIMCDVGEACNAAHRRMLHEMFNIVDPRPKVWVLYAQPFTAGNPVIYKVGSRVEIDGVEHIITGMTRELDAIGVIRAWPHGHQREGAFNVNAARINADWKEIEV